MSVVSLPLIGDFLNRRAKTKKSGQTWLDVGKVAIPAMVGGALTVTDALLKLLAPLPGVALLLQAAVPLILLIVCLYAVASRVDEQEPGDFPSSPRQVLRYRFTEPLRNAAKIASLPMALLAGYYAWGVIPNGLAGRDHVAGFICRASDQKGVTDGTIEVLDLAGEVVSKEPLTVDDLGFFYSELKWWGASPHSLRLSSPTCGTNQILLRDASHVGLSCPQDQEAAVDKPEKYKLWILTCR